ncbi:DUF555 domain-containing protein [Methanosarcina sp. KYL-1]|uniref:DUF555 domain-containing protein n=1 Tax=Methanosarcina sp. KYL-1 TaxID=2602068 RepID=UPI002101BDC0|nr:DUF555 domain-containing protein [Methanosarcina sp. KYL-1]MCQ1535835.1 DUF555 domain-containing protein [Methanosarcina sp. KYL-1]
MTNFHVVLEAAWLVRDVKTADDAIGVAISEAGKRLNPKLDFVEVDVGTTYCPACNEPFGSVFIAANTALVGLIFEMKVFDAESAEHAERIAKSVIGKSLRDIPLKVVEVTEFERTVEKGERQKGKEKEK